MKRPDIRLFDIGFIFFCAVVAVFSFISFFNDLKSDISNTANMIAVQCCVEEENCVSPVKEKIGELKNIAANIPITENFNEASVCDAIKGYKELMFIFSNGKVAGENKNLSGRDYFKKALSGKTAVYSETIGGQDYTLIALPVLANGEVAGVLAGKYKFEELNGFVANQYEKIQRSAVFLGIKLVLVFLVFVLYIASILNKKTEILKEQKNCLDALTSNVPGGFFCCENNESFGMKQISEGFLTLTGYSREEIEINFENTFIKMVYPQDRQALCEKIKNCGGFFEMQHRMIRRDGIQIWVLNKGQIVVNEDGSSFIYCVLVDITSLKKAERKLEEQRRELEVSNERYSIIINQIGCVVFDYDFSKAEVVFSRAYRRIFGYFPSSENFPDYFIEENLIHPDDIEKFERFYSAIANGVKDYDEELRIKDADGNFIPCNVHTTIIFDEESKPLRLIGRITELSRYNKKLQAVSAEE
ncbi:MAG: PAS domain-containing protein [Oscillospiraceae bacterium]|nr:PAS domain-containing protein [Oscillospiraceae bacterium]